MASESAIQKAADDIVKAAETDMAEVMAEQDEHGQALRMTKFSNKRTWVYEDGYRKDMTDEN